MKSILTILVGFIVLTSCGHDKYISLSGKTMGTYYLIQYSSAENYQKQVDSLLNGFISAASTYDSTSEISEFNRNGILYYRSQHLYRMLVIAKDIYRETEGAFEPTLKPLIDAHGFGKEKRKILSQNATDSLLANVSFDYIQFDSTKMWASKPGVQLDLSAMGEGYAIEIIAGFLDNQEVKNYKVEIGGEMKCEGTNPAGEYWLIGIADPSNPDQKVLKTIRLVNEAISTSGNYRKFYMDSSGRRISHIIDPKTGRSVENDLLSVTIRHSDAIRADAYATACMAMGAEKAKEFLEERGIVGFINEASGL
jgi:FAD:protein FMN transferase